MKARQKSGAGLMFQGTSSDAGKTTLVAGVCRVLMRRGTSVAPFKPQNMALNSAVTEDGREIGRAQALQALAAGVPAHADMNPVLLKPNTDTGAQVIIHGKVVSDMEAAFYHEYKPKAMSAVTESYQRLCEQYQAVIVEGAGSPAEINLRDRDIANMGFAEKVDCPVVLVADIDRGGVFAQSVGTLELLSDSEQDRVVGFIINKFRGDIKLLEPGLEWLEQRTQKPVLGVLPYLSGLELAAEDAINARQVDPQDDKGLRVVVPVFSRISNHTDFDPLRQHPQIELVYGTPGKSLPRGDLIILPGSKNVRDDLDLLRQYGWDQDIQRHLRYGVKLLGICGGYQMLGQQINDPHGLESAPGSSSGLGYLPITTLLQPAKQLKHSAGVLKLAQQPCHISGYEIHVGKTAVQGPVSPMIELESGEPEGAISEDNQVAGTYFHGLFEQSRALSEIMAWAGIKLDESIDYHTQQQQELNRLADACEQHIDCDRMMGFLSQHWRDANERK